MIEDAVTDGDMMETESENVHIPENIIPEILVRLPVKSLARFRCVSKPWLYLISSYKFAKAHLKLSTNNNAYIHDKLIFGSRTLPMNFYTCSIQSLFDSTLFQLYPTTNDNLPFDPIGINCQFVKPDNIRLVGSCNGLVCVHLLPDVILLWNPTTRESKRLSHSKTLFEYPNYCFSFAFGYDEVHDDYKAIEFKWMEPGSDDLDIEIKVYSLRTDSWKVLSNWPGGLILGGMGKFLNGAVHWLVGAYKTRDERVIVAHDLATDTFIEFTLPNLGGGDRVKVEVDILEGRLVLYCEHNTHMDVWVMKEYGLIKSWTKKEVRTVPFLLNLRDHGFTKPHPLFFSVDDKVSINYGTTLRVYDLSNPQSHQFNKYSRGFWVETTTYIESLVSPSLDNKVIIGRTMPKEIIEEILLRSPVKSLMRFKSVRKNGSLLFRVQASSRPI